MHRSQKLQIATARWHARRPMPQLFSLSPLRSDGFRGLIGIRKYLSTAPLETAPDFQGIGRKSGTGKRADCTPACREVNGRMRLWQGFSSLKRQQSQNYAQHLQSLDSLQNHRYRSLQIGRVGTATCFAEHRGGLAKIQSCLRPTETQAAKSGRSRKTNFPTPHSPA